MEIIRRNLLAAAMLGALAWAADPAKAMLFSGATPAGGGSLITTLTMSNTSGASETPMWSKVFGLGFPDSDATGCPLVGGQPTYPQFKVGSTVLGYSMSKAPTFHPSMMELMIILECLILVMYFLAQQFL